MFDLDLNEVTKLILQVIRPEMKNSGMEYRVEAMVYEW